MSEAIPTRSRVYHACSFQRHIDSPVTCSTHKQGPQMCAQFFFRQLEFALAAESRLKQHLEKYEGPGPKCNSGHVNNLPLKLWTCPQCDDKRLGMIEALKRDVEDWKKKGADAWVTGHQNHQLRWALKLARVTIERACMTEDGLDIDDGIDLMKLIDRKLGMRLIENEMRIVCMEEKIKAADQLARAAGDAVDTKGSLETLQPLGTAILEYGKVKVRLP